MRLSLTLLFFLGLLVIPEADAQSDPPLRVAVVGLTHSHVHWILGRPDRGDIQIVGIVEPNRDLAERFAKQHGYSMDMVYNTMEEMFTAVKPEAVTAFGSIYEHLEVVEACAPRGIHVMVEKPLAVSVAHAKKMQALAEKHQIHLLTNYETTWYATHHQAYDLIHNEDKIGDLRKIVVHDGHEGPMEIGVNQEFLDWLTDPVANGAGALTDFGCYGANLITWLMQGQRPRQVMAMTQQIKPDIYPKVDDEATILVEYPKTQGIIQASWNWPFGRKDMHIYGKTGYIYCDNRSKMRTRYAGENEESTVKLPERTAPFDDPFALLAAVVKGDHQLPPYALSSLENNMIVVEILEAAKKSARKGKAVKLK
ncbi:Gfo/Idh/MocA family protein [Flavilitoribacter nigricans]|uniref:Oxidoreductase n=1 Tax=Flavilitoribacter nigricans (strain ATCC 23147 / DSM 23189 / NBRC 102662 / NCIMB 1420 / SS-2) TaxID=1122177 RepID=A0A2D0NFV8_FLAN2|nr:Gfo/Idh/MocA family oxidoreductase [Flavilitoribacter nigricans]PHN06663.1 oxidoreductase [Flavilitoribacter nigricans DSM 23189 = NBRC 102662]